MKASTKRGPIVVWLALLALVAAPDLTAQEEPTPEQQQACVAKAAPGEIARGQAAVRLTVTLTEPIGEVLGFAAGDEGGLALARQEDLPRTPMANEGGPPKPITLAAGGTTLDLWLNTEGAEPGMHEILLTGTESECVASVTVIDSPQR